MDYQISNKAKLWTTIVIVAGLVLTGLGIIVASGEDLLVRRVLSNLLANSFFFLAIALGALFFLAVQYVSEVGWFAYIKRPIEAVTGYIPLGIAIMFVTLLVFTFLKGAGVYIWMDPEYTTPGAAHYDAIVAHKGQYLNLPFFWARAILYFAVFYFMWKGFIKRSLLQDDNPADALSLHYKNFYRAALFLVLYGFFSTTFSWDWIMSIDIHWHSTVFGWYVFSGAWLTAMVVIIMVLAYLKKLGYLPKMNNSHIHDIGKWIFSLSFLWSYLWFAQYMLIWYGNIPEEASYYTVRVEHYKLLFFGMFIINFVFPILILISRDAKRHLGALIFVGLLLIVGHWLDVWIMVFGGAMGPAGKIGFIEIGMGLLFLGVFTKTILYRLAKAPLVAKNEPYLEESIHHEI